MFKKLALLIALLFVGVAANAVPITYTAITNLIETDLASSSTITAAELRGVLNGMNDSYPNLVDAGVTQIQFGYLSGVTQDIQAQINNKQEESSKDIANGYAGLDANVLLARTQIPNPSYCLGSATFSAGLYTIASPSPSYASASEYNDGFLVIFRPDTINTGNSSLKVGSGPSKVIYLSDAVTTLGAGDIATNSMMMCVYNTSLGGFILMDPATSVLLDSNQFGLTTNLNTLGAYIKSGATMTNSYLVTPTLKNGTASAGQVPKATDASGNWVWSSDDNGASGSVTITTTNATVATNVISVLVKPESNVTITLPPASWGQRVEITKATNNAYMVFVVANSTNAIQGGASPFPLYFMGDSVQFRGDGNTNQVVVGGQNWANGNRSPRNYTGIVWDDMTAVTTTQGPGGLTHAGTVTSVLYSLSNKYSGIWQWTTGVTTNGSSFSSYRSDLYALDASPCIYQANFQIPVNLSSATEQYVIELGFGDANTTNDLPDTDAILIRYTNTEDSGNFRVRTTSALTNHTYTSTAVTAAIATWYRVTILASSTVVNVDINGTIVGPITSNVPTGFVTPIIKILKTGGSVGTTARLLLVDRLDASKYADR